MRHLTTIIGAAVGIVLGASAGAHEFWIQPESHTVPADEALRLTLMHGERYKGDPVARNDGYILRFECVGRDGVTPVRGLEGQTTSFARPEGSTDQILVYHSREYTNLLDADAFHAYLREEGLGEIIERRAALGESELPGREVYSRCAKSLITIGDGAPADRSVGLPYELVLLDGASEGQIRARVLIDGQAAPGARVVAVTRDQPESLHEATSDEHGVVTFEGATPGAWMLTSIHMERLEGRGDADWQSYWASLTFQAR